MSLTDHFSGAVKAVGSSLAADRRAVQTWLGDSLRKIGLGSPAAMTTVRGALMLGGAALVTGACTLWTPALVATQLLGLAGLALTLKAASLNDNRQQRAAGALGGTLMTAQMALLGAWGGMLQTGTATARSFAMAALPDEMIKTRAVAAALSYVAVLGVYYTLMPKSPYDWLALTAMTLGTMADICPSELSRHSRVGYILGKSFMLPYHLLKSQSIGGVANTAMGVALLVHGLCRYDVPVRTEEGKPIGGLAAAWRWASSLVHLGPPSGLSSAEWEKRNVAKTGDAAAPVPPSAY